MKQNLPRTIFTACFMFSCLGATIPNNIEKVDIYLGHSLLQTWPLAHRTINIEVDPLFPPDTLIFRATGSKESLEQAKLEIKDLSGSNIISKLIPQPIAKMATVLVLPRLRS